MRTLDDFSGGYRYKEVNKELMEIYQEELQKCNRCELGKIYPNNKRKLYGVVSNKPILIISQNPSFLWAKNKPDLKDIHGGNLGAIDRTYENILSKELKKNNLPSIGSKNLAYITNVLKCCTEKNEYPSKESVKKCADKFLLREIKIIKPKLILTLGKLGEWYLRKEEINKIFNTKFFPHPGYIRRKGYNLAKEFTEDFVKVIANEI